MAQADIAVIGMAVMGRNLAMNIAEKGFKVAVFNRSPARTDEAIKEAGDLASNMIACRTVEELVAALKPPRALLLMVKAGAAVDETIEQLKPHLSQGDIIIDAGNANYRDSVAHDKALGAEGFQFLGVGVSGGEEGARHGPSIMVGGSPTAYERVKDVLNAIAARYEGASCCGYMGPAGAGHFVKTLHNGIEYADMQMIAEAYGLMRSGLGMTPSAIADVFEGWTKGPLASYLTEISVQALRAVDPATSKPLVDIILDSAGQKGTGRWSAIEALDLGVPASAIAAAVEARGLSSMRSLRKAVNGLLGDAERASIGSASPEIIAEIEKTLLTGKILAYAQGFDVLAAGSKQFDWDLPLAEIAKIWRAGCIIRSRMLDSMSKAYSATPAPESLILDPDFAGELKAALPSARKILGLALANGHPVPALTSAVNYLQQLRTSRATVDLVQAQRDIFGAHGFERVDQPGAHHGPWHTGAE